MRRLPPGFCVPLLLLLTAQKPPPVMEPGCEDYARERTYAPFVTLAAIETGRPVALRPGAVLAQEIVQYGYPAWRTAAPVTLRIPGGQSVTWPAGTPVVTSWLDFNDMRPCLPAPQVADSRRLRTRLHLCLVDRDGDGRFEAVERLSSMPGAHVPMLRGLGSEALPAPLRVVEDPRGDPVSRNHAHRRLVLAALDGDSATFAIRDTIHDLQEVRRPYAPEVFDPRPDGSLIYRVRPSDMSIPEPGRGDRETGGEVRVIRLANGATVEIAGLRLRIARTRAGWSATPLSSRFAPWIARQCGGRRLHVGRPG